MPMPEEFYTLVAALTSALKRIHGTDLLFAIQFGSTARGTLKQQTDVDLFVCLKSPLDRPSRRHEFIESLEASTRQELEALASKGYELQLSPHYRSESGIQSFSPLHLDIATEGIILLDPEGRAIKFMQDIQERMRRRGTKRKRIGMKWYWTDI